MYRDRYYNYTGYALCLVLLPCCVYPFSNFLSLFYQVLLSVLASEPRGGHVIRRLQQEVQRQATRANHDVTPITMALMAGFQHSKAAHNLSSMLSKDSLNPADIVQLHRSEICMSVSYIVPV